MKKIFKLLALATLILLIIISATSCASTPSAKSASGELDGGLKWSYASEGNTLTISGDGNMTDFESASEVPWKAAKASVKSIIISDGVKNIGDYAFYSFSALESITIPDTVEKIGVSAFAFSSITEISIPAGVTVIEDRAFEGCSSLIAAFVPASVSTLGDNVFAYCYSITDAAILANVAIPENAFKNCTKLDKLLVKEDISDDMVAENAFDGCPIDFSDATKTASSDATASVTVNYVDENGQEMSESVVKAELAYGASYSIVSPSVEGYTADKLTVTGNVFGSDVTVTVTYTEDKPVETTAPVTDVPDEKEEITPSTIVAIVIFGVVLVAIAVGAFLLMRSDKKNASKAAPARKNTNQKGRK